MENPGRSTREPGTAVDPAHPRQLNAGLVFRSATPLDGGGCNHNQNVPKTWPKWEETSLETARNG